MSSALLWWLLGVASGAFVGFWAGALLWPFLAFEDDLNSTRNEVRHG